MAATNIPIIVQGNSFNLAIPLQIYVIQNNEMVLQDYTPDPTDDVSIQLKGCRRNYTYTPTVEGNVAKVYLTGNELADNYSIVVSIVKANGERLRSFRTDQFFIVESSDDLTQADIIAGLEDNVIYLQPQYFIAGEDGRGIVSVAKTSTSGLVDTYTITYTDNTTSTFQVTNGALQPVIVDIEGDVTNAPDEEDLTSENNGNHDVLKFKDKAYMPTIASGLGRQYLRKNFVNGVNKLTQAMIADANTIYHIQYDYDLGGETITMPANSALKIDGGKIDNGKIIFQDTSIESDKECFGEDLEIEGKVLQEANPDWFVGSDADKIEKAIDVFGVVKLAARDYLIDRTINVQHSFRLNGCGIPSNFGNFATPSKSNDYSSSRLIPIADIGNILACVEPSGRYVSFVLSGVSFVRPTSEAWYNDYKSLTTNVNGFAISTPNGPSRPAVIENCNFSRLNYGIYIYDANPSLNRSTNISRLLITGCNLSLNKQGIHAEGRHTLGGVMIMTNVIEQNTEYGIYAYNPEGSAFDGDYVISGFAEITDNLMEGQPNPLYCSIGRCTLIFKGNYFEKANSTTNIRVWRGGSLTYGFQTLILDSNTASTNLGDGVVYDLAGLTLIDRDNGNAGGSLLMRNVKIVGNTNKKILTASYCGYTPALDNTVQPLLKMAITPNYIYDGKVQLGYVASSVAVTSLTLTEALPAGNYTLVVFGRRLAATLRKTVSGTASIIFDYTPISPIGSSEYTLNEKAFTLDEAIPAGSILKFGVQAGSGEFSGVAIYANDGTPHSLYSFNTMDYVNDTIGEVVNPQIGVERYDSTAGKIVRIADIIDGKAVWKDLDGFTPALSRGTTVQRPTATLGIDDIGFEYFDTDITKEMAFTFTIGTEVINLQRSGNTTYYETNPFANGDFARVIVISGYTLLNKIEIAFVKAENDETDAIYIQDGLVYTHPSDYVAQGFIVAPDPSVYTKIKLINNGSGYRRFRFYEASPSWIEADGAVAGVARSGDTASRPASADIYVGFQYWDTDLGKMIAWNGSAWVNLDGSALS